MPASQPSSPRRKPSPVRTPSPIRPAVSAVLDEDKAVKIYRAKASRTARDSTSAALATEYGITMKAVRDIWNLRTWRWETMPFWSRQDMSKFLAEHLCSACKANDVRDLAQACATCAGPRRRGRPKKELSDSSASMDSPPEQDTGSPPEHGGAISGLSTVAGPSACNALEHASATSMPSAYGLPPQHFFEGATSGLWHGCGAMPAPMHAHYAMHRDVQMAASQRLAAPYCYDGASSALHPMYHSGGHYPDGRIAAERASHHAVDLRDFHRYEDQPGVAMLGAASRQATFLTARSMSAYAATQAMPACSFVTTPACSSRRESNGGESGNRGFQMQPGDRWDAGANDAESQDASVMEQLRLLRQELDGLHVAGPGNVHKGTVKEVPDEHTLIRLQGSKGSQGLACGPQGLATFPSSHEPASSSASSDLEFHSHCDALFRASSLGSDASCLGQHDASWGWPCSDRWPDGEDSACAVPCDFPDAANGPSLPYDGLYTRELLGLISSGAED